MSSIDVLIFLLDRKRYSLGIPFLAGVLGFIIAWILPPYYKSEITVVLDTGSKTTGISSLVKNVKTPANLLGSLGSGMASQENEDLYLEIVNGRDVLLATIEKFRLDTIYKGAKYKETLLKQFNKDIKIKVDEVTGIISCKYEAKNKELARDLVRFIVEAANEKYVKLRKERALQIVEHLSSFRQNIVASADSLSEVLVKFYKDNNLLNLEAQLQLTISTLAGYEEQIKNLRISESKAGTDNPSAAELRKRREILEREAQKLRGEVSRDYVPSKKSVYINSDWAVEKLIEQQRMEMDLKRLFLTLETVESEITMEEGNAARNLPVIQVVQDAYLADYKSGPKRATWAVGFFMFAFAMVFIILILQGIYYNKLNCNKETKDNFIKFLKACLP